MFTVDTMDHSGRVIDPVYLSLLVETAQMWSNGSTVSMPFSEWLYSIGANPKFDSIGNIVQLEFPSEKHYTLALLKVKHAN